jgi:arginase
MDRQVELVGVPMDLGADRRGVDMGPSAIRYGGLSAELEETGVTCRDGGDLSVPRPEELDPDASDQLGGTAKYLEETRTVCKRLTERVAEIRERGNFPLVLGGDHSIGIGTAKGSSHDGTTGVIWLDAHGDFNTPTTTPSGNIHGMPVAAMLGRGPFDSESWAHSPNIPASNVAQVGIRSLDTEEREALRASEVSVFTMPDIDRRGITSVVEEAVEIATSGVDQLYVSLDMDFLDPSEAPGVGTPVRGGASYREAHAAVELIHDEAAGKMCALDIVEVNPILDSHNATAELACELAASSLGDSIL